MISLSGLGVLVTRPGSAGTALCQYLAAHGAQSWHFPTIAFAPPQDDAALQQAIMQLAAQDYWIFNSPQAVYATTDAIHDHCPHRPSSVQIAAIGAGTKAALHAAGYTKVIQPQAEWNSEGLLNLPLFQAVKDKKIAIIRGEGGREKLAHSLIAREAKVLQVVAYRRILPHIDLSIYEPLLYTQAIQIMVGTSFEGVQNLKILWGAKNWDRTKMIPLLVVSERVKMLAHDLGFQTIWVARNASHQAMLESIADAFQF